jgi:hypothetical protein
MRTSIIKRRKSVSISAAKSVRSQADAEHMTSQRGGDTTKRSFVVADEEVEQHIDDAAGRR